MKRFCFLFVMTFVLVFFAGSAGALGGDVEMGYLSLPVRADSSIPLRVQAGEAYERFLPVLLAAQRSGSILEYHPEFAAGIVKIKFSAGARPAMLGGLVVYDDVQVAVSKVPHATRPARELRAAYDPEFILDLYDGDFSATGLVSGDRLTGKLYDNMGKLLAVADSYADALGDAFAWFDGSLNDVLPGYKVIIKVYSAGGGLRGTYQVTAPKITIDSFNNASSVASGTGPAGKPYEVTWFHPNEDAGNTTLNVTKTGTISGAGTWSKDFGTTPIRGADEVTVSVNVSTRFWIARYLHVPYSYCYPGDFYCAMFAFPNQAVFMTVTHAGTPHTYTGTADFDDGWFGQDILDSSSNPILLVSGDKFQGTNISAYNLPNLTATFNYTTDVVSGRAPANKYFWVYVSSPSGSPEVSAWVHSNAAGIYSFNLHAIWDISMKDPFVVEVLYHNPASGNRTYLYKPFGP